jgi:hypothetical protein
MRNTYQEADLISAMMRPLFFVRMMIIIMIMIIRIHHYHHHHHHPFPHHRNHTLKK